MKDYYNVECPKCGGVEPVPIQINWVDSDWFGSGMKVEFQTQTVAHTCKPR